jgi:predicted RNA-binding protein with PIN domain
MRRYVIDGYNLMHQMPELRKRLETDLEGCREALLARLAGFAHRKSAPVTVIFDGARDAGRLPNRWKALEVRFSIPPQKADPVIKAIIAARKKGEDMVIVTSDRDIGMYARLCGVRVESAQAFAASMQAEPATDLERKYDSSLSENELEEWVRLFNRESEGRQAEGRQVEGQQAEDRGLPTEGQQAEDRGLPTEGPGLRTEGRRLRTEDRRTKNGHAGKGRDSGRKE